MQSLPLLPFLRRLAFVTGLFLALAPWFPASMQAAEMCGSDWPVWEYARGMNDLKRLDGFQYSYRSYNSCLNGYEADKVDVTFMTLYDFITLQRTDADGVIIAVQDYSNGGDGIVLRGDIKSAADLKGKTIGLQVNSISLFVLHLYLEKNGMSLNDVKLTNIKGELVSKAFAKDKDLAGVVGWNPNLDDAVKAGGKIVATSADFPEHVFDVVVVKKASLAKDRALYEGFIKAWFQAINDDAVLVQNAKNLKVSDAEFKGWLRDAKIYRNAKDSAAMFGKMRQVAEKVQTFLQTPPSSVTGSDRALFGPAALKLDDLFDASLLK